MVERGQGSLSSSGLNDARVEVLWLHKRERKKKKPAGIPPQSPSREAGALQDKTESKNSSLGYVKYTFLYL